MRFASIPQRKPQEQQWAPAVDLVRRLVNPEAPARALQPAPPRSELPFDLDQRVRLVGEW